MQRFSQYRSAGVIVAFAIAVAAPRAARADHIDDALIKAAPEMVKELERKGFKNVGVLKFLVKKGKSATDGTAGPLNMNMADRVENALIYGMDDAKPLGVIQDATHVASKADPKFGIKSAEVRKALFSHKYPLRWGMEKVSADAFLTGTVDLSTDMKKTTVEIGYFDKTGVIHALKSFELKTDRSILADSGQSFAIAKRSLKGKRSLDELDDQAAKSAATADNATSVNKQLANDGDSAADQVRDSLQRRAARHHSGCQQRTGEMRVASPQTGQTVSFVLTNSSQSKIGVVVKVNSVSTIENETGEDQGCMKWILEPGKQYMLRGFYVGSKIDLFKVLDDDQTAARITAGGNRLGYIDVTVFSESQGGDEMKAGRTLRSLNSHSKKATRPTTASEVQAAVKKAASGPMHSSRKSRNLIDGGGGSEDKVLESDALKNPTQIYQMQISYYKPGSP